MAVVVSSVGQDAERERSALEALLRRQISGLIVACASADQAYLAPWQSRTPMVFVDRPPKGISGVYVIEDDLAGAREAVTHLASHGHRRVAFLGISTPITTIRRRLKSYRSTVAELGLDDRPDLICMPSGSADECAAELVKLLEAPDAAHRGLLRDHAVHDVARPGLAAGRAQPTSPWSDSVTFRWPRRSRPRSRCWIRTRPGSAVSPWKDSSSASRIPRPRCAAGPFSRFT